MRLSLAASAIVLGLLGPSIAPASASAPKAKAVAPKASLKVTKKVIKTQAKAAPEVATTVLTSAGADVTDYLMRAVLKGYATDPLNTNGDATASIPSLPDAPYTVPADATCEARTYVVTGTPPTTYTAPASAGAGKTALKDPTNLTNGCIDIARSSSGVAAGEPAGFRYFGFGKDAMTWAAFAGGKAPATLTKAQIKGIYDCTYTDWSEVGGKAGHITRYFTQAGSGAGKIFQTNILDGFDPTTVSSASCPAVVGYQQSHGDLIPAAERPFAILPYSTGAWVSQANGVSPNVRGGALARPITVAGVAQDPIAKPKFGKYAPNTAVITGGFIGAFTLYNIVDTDSVAYASAVKAIGYDVNNKVTGFKSPLCKGQLVSVLQTYGVTPFAADGNGITCTFAAP